MSSFQKVKQNDDLLDIRLSTGQINLDHILGGGLPLGSILLIEEDKYVKHARTLSELFLAAGVAQKNPIFYGTLESNVKKSELSLPAPLAEKAKNDIESGGNDMRIAWRYNALPQFESSVESRNRFISNFDLSHKIKSQDIENHEIYVWNFDECAKSDISNPKLTSLLNSIHQQVKDSQFLQNSSETLTSDNFLRVCIQSIGSPLWYSSNLESDLIRFFAILKALIKSTNTVCLITIPAHLLEKFFKSTHTMHRIYNSCDFVIELKSICKNDDLKTVFKDYSGILNLKKLSAVNALTINYTGTYDLAYKMSMKKFTIETLHLPPDIPENDNSQTSSFAEMPSLACAGGSKKHLLEF